MKKLKIKINSEGLADALGVKAGSEMEIDVSKTGIPVVREWRNRLRDSVIDNCISVVKKEVKSKKEAK